jgi:hypothetical protein
MGPLPNAYADSPESVFAFAQQSMISGDWESFFRCLDVADLRRIAAMVVPLACTPGEDEFAALCVDHGATEDAIARVQAVHAEIAVSATAVLDPALAPADRGAVSLRHRDLVKSHDALVAEVVRGIVDLPAFVAASERFRRRNGGGGSVSSQMFVDERLVDVVVSGKQAQGLRRRTVGGDDPIGFVLGRNGWRIRLFAGRSSRAV